MLWGAIQKHFILMRENHFKYKFSNIFAVKFQDINRLGSFNRHILVVNCLGVAESVCARPITLYR